MGLEQLNDIISSVSKIINYIRSRALVHREFKGLFEKLDSEFSDLLLYTDIRWLSKGRMCDRFYDLIPQITIFFENKNILEKFTDLSDYSWILKVAFLSDITSHLNNLNIQLQGRDCLIVDTVSKILAFQRKLNIYREQFENFDFTNFPKFCNAIVQPDLSLIFYLNIFDKLIEEFNTRFSTPQFQIFQLASQFYLDPFHFDLNNLKQLCDNFSVNFAESQNELIELQSEIILNRLSILEQWKLIKYYNLKLLSKKILCSFGSTYTCESTFSTMKNLKTKLRTCLLDESLVAQLVCSCTSLEPRYMDLVKINECHISN